MSDGYEKIPGQDYAHLWARDGMWYVRAMVGGQRKKCSTGEPVSPGLTALRRAQRRRDEILVAWRDEDNGWQKKRAITWDEWWAKFEASYLKGYPKTSQGVFRVAASRAQRLLTRRAMDEIPRSLCVRLLNDMATEKLARGKRNFSVASIHTTYVCLHRIFEAAVADHVMEANPWQGIPVEKPKPRERVLSWDEQQRLLPTLDAYHARWCLVILGSGLRIRELAGLTVGAIDFAAELMSVLGKGSRKHRGGKWRDVPIRSEVAELLREQIAERTIDSKPKARLWPHANNVFDGQLRRRSKWLNIPPVTPHTLRHTFATRWVESRGDIYMLSKVLGHESVEITAKMYVHESKRSLVEAIKAVNLGLSGDHNKLLSFPRTSSAGVAPGVAPAPGESVL